jgi:hypothetical protein
MHNLSAALVVNLIHVPVLLFLLWAVYCKFFSPKPLPRTLAVPGRVLGVILILITLGFLAGCGDSDPLAVASGPLFPLNAGHWQPTPQELAAAPPVVDR